jgi:NAD(P)H-hydrate epimerase
MAPLTLRPLSRDEVRSIEARAAAECAVPTLILMENAGRGAAALLRERFTGTSVVVLCGPGNNGGDGGVVARHLDLWGFSVRVVWCADPARLKGDALAQWTILDHSGIDQSCWRGDNDLDGRLSGADVIVDGLLGTGLTRPVEGPLLAAIEAVNRSGTPVLALDLPSGLDADLGVPLGAAVRARVTASFVAPKLGFLAPGADAYTGAVVVVDIGAPRRLLEPFRAG